MRSDDGQPGRGAGESHGPKLLGEGVELRVWAPSRTRVELVVYDDAPTTARRLVTRKMRKRDDGYHAVVDPSAAPGTLYAFVVDGEGPFPDPASRSQPFGVHGPSRVVDTGAFRWTDADWRGRGLEELVIYELHVGAATAEGTFAALVDRLDHIVALGATAIEIMPIADFPGERNWGYDGVSLYAPARCYGAPADLAALVDAAHARGLAVILDVVYNHLGPDGNYLRAFSPAYFTPRHSTPWGDALDYDGPSSGPVRRFIVENAAYWIRDYHVDALRLDATHAIIDDSEPHLLADIATHARAAAPHRKVLVFAEDERNEVRLVRETARGGLGLDGVWADDLHHEVRRIVAGDDEGYFGDFGGDLDELVTILREGWLYAGQRSRYSGKPRGTPAGDTVPARFIHCIQNHDQIGNRARGDRLNSREHGVPLSRFRAATTLLLATPYTPLLFMGEELGASSPFAYFTDHEPGLGKLVTEGRRREFGRFRAFADEKTRAAIPDPQAESTFRASKLDWREADRSPGRELLALHRALLALRASEPAMRARGRDQFDVGRLGESFVAVRRRAPDADAPALLFVVALTRGGFADLDASPVGRAGEGRAWSLVLDSEQLGGAAGPNVVLERGHLTMRSSGAAVLRERRVESPPSGTEPGR